MESQDLEQIKKMIEGVVREEVRKLELVSFIKNEIEEIKIRTSEENLKKMIEEMIKKLGMCWK